MKMTEHHDRWSLIVPGAEVMQLRFDNAVTLVADTRRPHVRDGFIVRIENEFTLVTPDGSRACLVPEEPVELAPVLRLIWLGIQRMDALKDGSLEIEFSDGTTLHASADDYYEAWQLWGDAGEGIVSTPGRELAVWYSSQGGEIDVP